MKLSAEQLARLPSWALYDANLELVQVDTAKVFCVYLNAIQLEKTQFGVTVVRRIIEEQIIRAIIKMQVIRYVASNQYDVLGNRTQIASSLGAE